jgi:hypothetical protein
VDNALGVKVAQSIEEMLSVTLHYFFLELAELIEERPH